MYEDERKFTDSEALRFHSRGKPGKLEINATKPMATQRDLSLAYSPGVAAPVLAIADNPDLAYDYTAKGNMVAVISNGTAILGLGNLGPLASKPVMEGKAALFKRFAGMDAVDICIDTADADEFINAVRYLAPSFGGINLEDIKSPECYVIEQKLREIMPIPVIHDDQHGTAIICAAGMINALDLTGRDIAATKIVMNGAGAAGIACINLLKSLGARSENIIAVDRKGVIYQGREGVDQWKSALAADTEHRTLEEALVGSDVFLGVSAAGVVTRDMVKTMGTNPIIFAMANPEPEIWPEDVYAVRDNAIVATGRSDYPNQVNNVLGFPYIFRGALDVRASQISEEMKLAAAQALAELAREDVPDEVAMAYPGPRPKYGPKYIIPVPFDPRLIQRVPAAVAQAAMDSGVAQKPIVDINEYMHQLAARLDSTTASMQGVIAKVQRNPKRIVFAEGEEQQVIRAAISFRNAGMGTPVLIGREDRIREAMEAMGLNPNENLEIHNAQISDQNEAYRDLVYSRLQRRGFLERDCRRMVNQDRNVFGAAMVATGDADGMVTGVTRNASVALNNVRRVLDTQSGSSLIGVTLVIAQGRTIVVADTMVNDMPDSETLARISIEAAGVARRLGFEPRVAFLSYSTFGQPTGERAEKMRMAVELLADWGVDFEFEGEMAADVALDPELMKNRYPFSRLTGPANVLVMPAIHSASISSKLLSEMGSATLVGPLLIGLEKPVQIASPGCTVSDIVNLAAFAAFNPNR